METYCRIKFPNFSRYANTTAVFSSTTTMAARIATTEKSSSSSSGTPGGSIAGIVGGVVGILVLAILIAVVAAVMKKRMQPATMPQTGSNGAAQQARGVGNGKNVTQNHAFEHHGATAAGSVGSAGGSSEVVYVVNEVGGKNSVYDKWGVGSGAPVYAVPALNSSPRPAHGRVPNPLYVPADGGSSNNGDSRLPLPSHVDYSGYEVNSTRARGASIVYAIPMDYDVGTLAVYAVPAGEAEQSQGNGRPVYATAVGGGANGGGGETKESSNV